MRFRLPGKFYNDLGLYGPPPVSYRWSDSPWVIGLRDSRFFQVILGGRRLQDWCFGQLSLKCFTHIQFYTKKLFYFMQHSHLLAFLLKCVIRNALYKVIDNLVAKYHKHAGITSSKSPIPIEASNNLNPHTKCCFEKFSFKMIFFRYP